MSKIKVLSFSLSFLDAIDEYFVRYTEIPPVFNRDGHYYHVQNDIAWYEYGGRAFLDVRKSILDELRWLNALEKPFDDNAKQAVRTLAMSGHLTNDLRERYYTWSEAESIRQTGRNVRKFYIGARK